MLFIRTTSDAEMPPQGTTRSLGRLLRRQVAALWRAPGFQQVAVPAVIVTLLATHAGLLAYAATRHSPTLNEPAHLVAGLSYLRFSRFDIYTVNPPLSRLLAAAPVHVAGYAMDWRFFDEGPGHRPEFSLGAEFIHANGERSIQLFTMARWACMPISLLGGVICFLWSRDLYGLPAGLVSLCLWCFDPNILAHAELVTPDVAATSLGLCAGYVFWGWLKKPTRSRAALAGVLLGFAQLSKMSLLFLFGLWPMMWIFWILSAPRVSRCLRLVEASQLATILAIALFVLNAGYLFEGTFTAADEFAFVSKAFTGPLCDRACGNRFTDTCFASVPIPLPRQYVLGLDLQCRDFDSYGSPSFLNGTWSDRGWWYYYLYALSVKVPHSTQALLLGSLFLICPSRLWQVSSYRDDYALAVPAAALFVAVSCETEFTHHFRYVLPSLGLCTVLMGRFVRYAWERESLHLLWRGAALALPLCSTCASLIAYPDSLSYFNSLAGGAGGGHRRLLHSSHDWGQDFLQLRAVLKANPGIPCFGACHVSYDPRDLGIDLIPLTVEHFAPGVEFDDIDPGMYAVSTMCLFGGRCETCAGAGRFGVLPGAFACFRNREPFVRAGNSIWVYKKT